MPLKQCSSGGKSGWKYGDSGHCYTGPGAKRKAIKQWVAISMRSGEKFHASEAKEEIKEALDEFVKEQNYNPVEIMLFYELFADFY